jgi:glc operon protein GlcG
MFPKMLTLSMSRQIVDKAIERAGQLDARISVAVCDNRGRLIALNRMDGAAGWDVERCSMGKAVAAAVTGSPSDQLAKHLHSGRPMPSSICNVVPPTAQRGGLPIMEGGVVQGACGVSGAATSEQDEECAKAGITALDAPRTETAAPNSATTSRTL